MKREFINVNIQQIHPQNPSSLSANTSSLMMVGTVNLNGGKIPSENS